MDRARTAARAVADIAVQALGATSSVEAMRRVTDALLTLIGADNVLYHEFERAGWSGIHAVAPYEAWEALPLHGAPTSELRRLHPSVEHVVAHDVVRPFALTDLVSERQWRDAELVSLMRPVWGKTLKLQITVPTGRSVVTGWAATRDGSDYSRGDLEVAAAVQPVLQAVARQYVASRGLPAVQDVAGLTERELVVLSCVAQGHTASRTGRVLGISGRTVSKHLEHVYSKLGCSDRVTAVNAARERGLLGAGSGSPPATDAQRF